MAVECKFCSRKFDTAESMNQHIHAKHGSNGAKQASEAKPGIKKTKNYFIIIALIAAIAIFSYTFYARSQGAGQYDGFAKCLSSTGAVVYGNDFCQYTAKQMNWFGKSEKLLNYVKCIENEELCDSKGVKTTPTWEINGSMYEGVQSFEKLSEISGCSI